MITRSHSRSRGVLGCPRRTGATASLPRRPLSEGPEKKRKRDEDEAHEDEAVLYKCAYGVKGAWYELEQSGVSVRLTFGKQGGKATCHPKAFPDSAAAGKYARRKRDAKVKQDGWRLAAADEDVRAKLS